MTTFPDYSYVPSCSNFFSRSFPGLKTFRVNNEKKNHVNPSLVRRRTAFPGHGQFKRETVDLKLYLEIRRATYWRSGISNGRRENTRGKIGENFHRNRTYSRDFFFGGREVLP